MTENKTFDWEDIETEIQAIYLAAPSHVQKNLIPHCYVPGAWRFTTSQHIKKPCICCGEIPAQMAYLTNTINLRGTDPVCLCMEHYRAWKMDGRTEKRYREETARSSARIKQMLSKTPPQTPEGWQVQAEGIVESLNKELETLRLDVPALIGLTPEDCLAKLRSLKTIREHVEAITDEARTELYLRGMKRPAASAFTPGEPEPIPSN